MQITRKGRGVHATGITSVWQRRHPQVTTTTIIQNKKRTGGKTTEIPKRSDVWWIAAHKLDLESSKKKHKEQRVCRQTEGIRRKETTEYRRGDGKKRARTETSADRGGNKVTGRGNKRNIDLKENDWVRCQEKCDGRKSKWMEGDETNRRNVLVRWKVAVTRARHENKEREYVLYFN